MKKQQSHALAKVNDVNEHILNIITPSGFDYDQTHANIGEHYGKIYTISRYSADGYDFGWLASLCSLEGTITAIEYRYTDSSNLINLYDKKIAELRNKKDEERKDSVKKQIDKAIEDLDNLIKRLSINREPVGYINIMLLIQHTDSSRLEERIRRVSGCCSVEGCNLLNLREKQDLALMCIAPYGLPNQIVARMGERNMPISTFIGGFPMANSGINDPNGWYIARTIYRNRLVILNQWIRNRDRTNSNWFITGVPGTGKSTFVKMLNTLEFAFGTKIIVLDPEGEYVDHAKHPDINGDVIDGAGGKGRINPLQVRPVPRITEEDLDENESLDDYLNYGDEGYGISDLALHIQTLRVIFKLYFGKENFDSGIKAVLEENLIETYKKFGMTWDTDFSGMKPEDFPYISHLYETVRKNAAKEGLSEYKRSNYDKLIDMLYPAAEGADKFLWNGPTTINPKSDYVVINCSNLLELEDNVQRAQFMNLTSWAWKEMSADINQRVQLDVDEGYLYVDPDYPDLMKFIRNVSKRDRKYEAALAFITHSVVDVLDPTVKRYGQAIIDNSTYRFIMGCDGKNLQETKKLFNLTEKEESLLAARNRSTGILFAGRTRLDARIDVPEKFLEMFGKRGGR